MFKVMQDYENNMCKDYAKVHYTSTSEIADEITDDLTCRFGNMLLTIEKDNECMWDPGGMMMCGDEVFNFKLNHITILCKAQHFEYFSELIKDYTVRGNKTKYIKIHGAYNCICITPEEFEELKILVTDSKLYDRAEKSWQERENRLNDLEKEGVLKRVNIDIDGNKYELPILPTDKKDLN
jgi:hypothetical protein